MLEDLTAEASEGAEVGVVGTWRPNDAADPLPQALRVLCAFAVHNAPSTPRRRERVAEGDWSYLDEAALVADSTELRVFHLTFPSSCGSLQDSATKELVRWNRGTRWLGSRSRCPVNLRRRRLGCFPEVVKRQKRIVSARSGIVSEQRSMGGERLGIVSRTSGIVKERPGIDEGSRGIASETFSIVSCSRRIENCSFWIEKERP